MQLARDAFIGRVVREIDQNPTGKAIAREGPDLGALVEPVLEDLVRLELDRIGLVDLPPEEFVALDARGVAGFRQAVGHGVQSEDRVRHRKRTGGNLQLGTQRSRIERARHTEAGAL